jgi:hypothetical protein
MIPAGYMLKNVVQRPEWIKAESVIDIYSVSNCISDDFADYVKFFKHNGYWLFDSPEVLRGLTESEQIDVSELTLFYYEVFEQEYNEGSKEWSTFSPETSFPTAVVEAQGKRLEGYDVATFSARTNPECSPLSCNSLATEVSVNEHCLFRTFEEAKRALECGNLNNSEPGPFRIFAVYSLAAQDDNTSQR